MAHEDWCGEPCPHCQRDLCCACSDTAEACRMCLTDDEFLQPGNTIITISDGTKKSHLIEDDGTWTLIEEGPIGS